MCTSLTLPTPDGRSLFGRTLDLDTHFGEQVTLTPRGFRFPFGDGSPQEGRYAILGMAAITDGYPLYAEAMNERGLCIAGLRFAGNAVFDETPMAGRINLAPWELIPYLLGMYTTVNEVRNALREMRVVDRPFSSSIPAAPLHWHIADADPTHGALVVEITISGMRVYDDSLVGVLTNNPPYPYQLARYAELAHLSRYPRKDESHLRKKNLAAAAMAELTSLGESGLGLPGDYSSPSRFVRAATLRRWVMDWMRERHNGGEDADRGGEVTSVAQFFRILGAVSPMAGAVMTEDGKSHRTLYSCCMESGSGVYHYFTEEDTTVKSVGFGEINTEGKEILTFSVAQH